MVILRTPNTGGGGSINALSSPRQDVLCMLTAVHFVDMTSSHHFIFSPSGVNETLPESYPVVNAWGANLTALIHTNLLAVNPGHGVFLDSCLHHCGGWGDYTIDGTVQPEEGACNMHETFSSLFSFFIKKTQFSPAFQ